ncbi:cytochrome c [bacterium]|nr:cytochrome c [bacterium]
MWTHTRWRVRPPDWDVCTCQILSSAWSQPCCLSGAQRHHLCVLPHRRSRAGCTGLHAGQADVPQCSTCHHTAAGQYGFSIGPNLAGVAERAGTRVAGMSAAEYLRQSILEPHDYVVSGYRDIMYPDYSVQLTEQAIEDLIAYLLTL